MTANKPSKLGRGIALALMGLTVFFTIVGAVGTTCVALGAENYESMQGLVPYKPLYQALVVISLAVGIWGIPVMISLVKGGPNTYRNALIVLIVGALTSGIQTAVSQSVRGSSAPVNVRFAVTAFTLVVFLLFRLPPIWDKMKFHQALKGDAGKTAGGAMLIVIGILTLAAPLWIAQTHMEAWISGVRPLLIVLGLSSTVSGVALLRSEVWFSKAKAAYCHLAGSAGPSELYPS
ncbi:MAG: hypothetical protein ACP5HS_07125 [Anaerolineae bacterium]